MVFSQKIEGETCKECGEEELYYWTEDETEETVEAYMNCDNCGREYSKIFIKRRDILDSEMGQEEYALEELKKKRL